MRKLFLLVLVIAAGYYAYAQLQRQAAPVAHQSIAVESDDALQRAFDRQQSNVQIQASAAVEKILSDDNDGSRHQRFIVRLASGQTVLIAHNIDLAPRVSPLAVGDRLQFSGEYEWNNKGGVVHWTHRDPAGRHQDGWIKRAAQTFQ